MYLVILTLYIPSLYVVQSKDWQSGGERQSETDRTREGIAARRGRQCDVTVENGQRGDGGRGVKLSCRCYQVKPPTAGCRYGDTMVTTRCSLRKEQDPACVKGLTVCVCSSLFLSSSVCLLFLISKVSCWAFCKITVSWAVSYLYTYNFFLFFIYFHFSKTNAEWMHTSVILFLWLVAWLHMCAFVTF